MKYWIAGLVLVTLGMGEYVFVKVAPYPPQKRLTQLGKITFMKPVAAPFLKGRDYAALDRIPKGWPAETKYRQEYSVAKKWDDEGRMAMAHTNLENLNTNISRWFLYLIDNGNRPRPVEEWEEERAVLYYSMVEDQLGDYGANLRRELQEKADSGDDWAIRIVEAILE